MPLTIDAKEFKELPWKNGKGFTREIYCIPNEASPDLFNFRLSMATVSQSSPFSLFPGAERFLMLLEGNGFRLKFEDQADAILSSPFDSLTFEGEEMIHCELLGGKCLDFNVMTNRSWGSSVVSSSLLKVGESRRFIATCDTFVFVYCPNPFLLVLKAKEEYVLEATENMVVIEISVTRKHFH